MPSLEKRPRRLIVGVWTLLSDFSRTPSAFSIKVVEVLLKLKVFSGSEGDYKWCCLIPLGSVIGHNCTFVYNNEMLEYMSLTSDLHSSFQTVSVWGVHSIALGSVSEPLLKAPSKTGGWKGGRTDFCSRYFINSNISHVLMWPYLGCVRPQ